MEGVFIDKGGAVVNVKHSDFAPSGGIAAQGNGVADDTAALQKAIDYAEAQYDATVRHNRHMPNTTDYHGVVLYFPPGRYRLTSKLMLKRPLYLLGAGYNESILLTDVNQPVMHFEPAVTRTTMMRARIERLGFEGSYVYQTANTALALQDGLYVTKLPNDLKGPEPEDDVTYPNTLVEVEACQFYGLGGAGIHGYFDEGTTVHAVGDKFSISGCHIEGCGSYGIRLDRRHATAYIIRNHITRNAGGIGLLGTQAHGVASSRILDNIIEANDGGPKAANAGSPEKPFVGVMLNYVNFCEVRGNYFEWHVNGVYVDGTCRNIIVARNWFDGNDVTLPKVHNEASGGSSFITRQLSPVHVADYAIGVVIEENDCYIPTMPGSSTDPHNLATWRPTGKTWGTTYEVFPQLGGSQHELIRNSAREAGGRRTDVTYQAGAGDRILFEGLRHITTQGLEVEHRERTYRRHIETGERLHLTAGALLALKAAHFEYDGGLAPNGVYHDYVYPEGLQDPVRARGVLYQRNANGTLTQKAALWQYTDQGFTFPLNGWNALGTEYGPRRIDFGSQGPPAAGDLSFWMQGSVRYNQAPSVLGSAGQRYTLLGWRCVADGYPGTWVEMRTPTGT